MPAETAPLLADSPEVQPVRRCYVLKKPGQDPPAASLQRFIAENFGIGGLTIRTGYRYDVDDLTDDEFRTAVSTVFSEAPVNDVLYGPGFASDVSGKTVIFIEPLPGQYDQGADSAEQCIELQTGRRPRVRMTQTIVIDGTLPPELLERVKRYLINPTDSREADIAMPGTLADQTPRVLERIPNVEGFNDLDDAGLQGIIKQYGLAMTLPDIQNVQAYFRKKGRLPTETELKVIDTYWSDHCRHTTFTTALQRVSMEGQMLLESGQLHALNDKTLSAAGKAIARAASDFVADRNTLSSGATEGSAFSLMDLALFSMREARSQGLLDDLEDSEENNAASIVVPVKLKDGTTQPWLLMFKNETHNHPTEIEPYGGAATCLGGAIRDPLSGRSYVVVGVRVTGSGDPREPLDATLHGKLPQRRITTGAADGFAGYGDQIGVPTPTVHEYYHPNFKAKRMEVGLTAGVAPLSQVRREKPRPGDKVIMVGGRTGRDGIGGASGSSVVHDEGSVVNRGAEVQKGNPVIERHLQRLYKNPAASRLIKLSNDFGAGGVSVAIGELANGIKVNLDRVPLKYAGLNGTEISISESQERMAVVVSAEDAEAFVALAAAENLEATVVGDIAEEETLHMEWNGQVICDLDREFLSAGWASRSADVALRDPGDISLHFTVAPQEITGQSLAEKWSANLKRLNVASQRGIQQHFDSTVGARTVMGSYGGLHQASPSEATVMRFPAEGSDNRFAIAESFDPDLAMKSPYHNGMFAVVGSVARLIASGVHPSKIRLTLQNYFEKLTDAERWGKPLLAQLGAREAQKHLGMPAIGGKDSMSGTFMNRLTGERLDVPPTLVSFAVGTMEEEPAVPSMLQRTDSMIVHLPMQLSEGGEPDWETLKRTWDIVNGLQGSGVIRSASSIQTGGLAGTLTKMCVGNRIGLSMSALPSDDTLFASRSGSLVVELPADCDPSQLFAGIPHDVIGKTQEAASIDAVVQSMDLEELQRTWESPLKDIFPLSPEREASDDIQTYPSFLRRGEGKAPLALSRKPRFKVLTFSGNNCEIETADAINHAGGEAEIVLFLNRTQADVRNSIERFVSVICDAEGIVIPGGFSAGDQPDGSAKFMANALRNPRIRDALLEHVRKGGLVLGICNGFQALVKSCLLPNGQIRVQEENDVTLAHNDIGHFLSMNVMHKVGSVQSPWMMHFDPDELADFPIAHGEGRLINAPRALIEAGQVPFFYADRNGRVRMSYPANPNFSDFSIAGLTDPTGRIFGMMAHPERAMEGLGMHIPTERKGLKLFRGGVDFFK